MCRQNHGVSVDYFAVGVMAYECMFGRVRKLHLILTSIFYSVPMWVKPEKRFVIIFCQSRFRSNETKFPEVGLSRQLTLSTK